MIVSGGAKVCLASAYEVTPRFAFMRRSGKPTGGGSPLAMPIVSRSFPDAIDRGNALADVAALRNRLLIIVLLEYATAPLSDCRR